MLRATICLLGGRQLHFQIPRWDCVSSPAGEAGVEVTDKTKRAEVTMGPSADLIKHRNDMHMCNLLSRFLKVRV